MVDHMTGFVQIIELKTSRIDAIRELVAEMRSEIGTGNSPRGTVTADRDRPGYYLNIVEFESHESAMENSARPEVSEFSARMAALCDEPPRFYNLDVVEAWSGSTSSSAKAAVAGTAAAAAGVAAAGAAKVRQRLQERRSQQSSGRGLGRIPTRESLRTVPTRVRTVPTRVMRSRSSSEEPVIARGEVDYNDGETTSANEPRPI